MNIIDILGAYEIYRFALLDQNHNTIIKSNPPIHDLNQIISNIETNSPISSFTLNNDSFVVVLTDLTGYSFILLFDSHDEYLNFLKNIITSLIGYLSSFSSQSLELKEILNPKNFDTSYYSEQKRQLELHLAHAIRTCDYKKIDPLARTLYYHTFHTRDTQSSYFIKNSIISLISALTRISINEKVDKRLAYDLSDKYIKSNFSLLETEPHKFINQLIYDFTFLIENHKYKFNSPLVEQAIIYIKNNLYSSLYVSDIAKNCHTSIEYLSSTFRKYTGHTVKTFIQNEKLDEAKFLLISTDLSIHEVALDLGYSSQSHFSKIFKEAFNISPSSFRKTGIY